MDWLEIGLVGLFLVTFLSATILPFSSEGVLIIFLVSGFDPFQCFIVSTAGNSFGGTTNYLIGRVGKSTWFTKLGLTENRIKKFENKVKKYGSYTALISWVPIIGDPLLIALGLFRTPILSTLTFMVIGKALRYAIIIYFIN